MIPENIFKPEVGVSSTSGRKRRLGQNMEAKKYKIIPESLRVLKQDFQGTRLFYVVSGHKKDRLYFIFILDVVERSKAGFSSPPLLAPCGEFLSIHAGQGASLRPLSRAATSTRWVLESKSYL